MQIVNNLFADPGCESSECPVKTWSYKGIKQNECSNPDGDSGGNWCPKLDGVDEDGNYKVGSGLFIYCNCGDTILPPGGGEQNINMCQNKVHC